MTSKYEHGCNTMLTDKLTDSAFIRFLIVGAINTINAYLVFAIMIFLGLHYTLATFIGGASSVILGFFMMSGFVFKTDRSGRFLPFVILFLLLYLANIGIQWSLHQVGITNDYIAGAIALVIAVLLSFFANRHLVFRF